jgi:hypothetical protein
MKFDVLHDDRTGRWIPAPCIHGKLTKAEAVRVCQIKNGTNVAGPRQVIMRRRPA